MHAIINSKNTFALAYLRVWNYYKFITLKVEKFVFFCLDDMSIVSRVCITNGSTCSLPTKNNLQSCLCGLSSLALTSIVEKSLSLKMYAFNYHKNSASLQLTFSTPLLLPLDLSSVDVQPTQNLTMLLGSPKIRDGSEPHNQQNICKWLSLHELWTGHLEGNHDSTP